MFVELRTLELNNEMLRFLERFVKLRCQTSYKHVAKKKSFEDLVMEIIFWLILAFEFWQFSRRKYPRYYHRQHDVKSS